MCPHDSALFRIRLVHYYIYKEMSAFRRLDVTFNFMSHNGNIYLAKSTRYVHYACILVIFESHFLNTQCQSKCDLL